MRVLSPYSLLVLFAALCPLQIQAVSQNPSERVHAYIKKTYDREFDELLVVSVDDQTMWHIRLNEVLGVYPVSTAEKGVGNQAGSNKTPLGLHHIRHRIGDGVPLYGRFDKRRFTGSRARIYAGDTRSPTDDILTRILWLSGDEKGVNKGGGVDSYRRYIYIHGTSEEGRIGKPASHGCIRMKNQDVLKLFDRAFVGMKVLILSELPQ